MTTVAVLDYGAGNIRSAVRAVERTGVTTVQTSDPETAEDADGLVVPGVGAFTAVMSGLQEIGAVDVIRRRHERGQPLLAVCVGLQVLFASGTEHGRTTRGIGLWPGEVTRLHAPVVPHMGWSTVTAPAESAMFAGLREDRFYFVHSYAAHHQVPGVLNTTTVHGERFVAAIEDGTTWATQFHPEKSAAAGARLLDNWVSAITTHRGKARP